jgi:tetratricopeptide (TPR) repeat protein
MNRLPILILSFVILLSSCANKKVNQNSTSIGDTKVNSLMIDAMISFNNGDLSKAENIYNEILTQNADNAAALYYLSNIEFQKQNINKSIEYGKKAIEKDNNNIWYKLQLADVYLSIQDYDNTIKVFETIVKQQPSVIEYWQQLVSIYHVKSDTKGELNALDRMEKVFGVNDQTSMLKYNLYLSQKDTSKAEQEILKLAKAFPSQTKYWSILAEMRMKAKDYDKAFEYYKKVEQTESDNNLMNFTYVNYYLAKNNSDSVYYYLKKGVWQEDLDFSTKLNVLTTIYGDKVDTDSIVFNKFFSLLETMRQTKDTSNCELWGLLNIGYMRQNAYKQASYSAQKAIAMGCGTYDTYINWLYSSSTFMQPNDMIEIADKTIETYPEQPMAYLFKGVNQEASNKYEAAVESLKMGLDRTGTDKALKEDFYMNLGDCYHVLGQTEEMYKNYDKALELNPNNYSVLNNYAYYLSLDNKDLDKALTYIEKVIAKYPNELTFVDTYAWVLYQRGEYAKAKQVMDKFLSSRPTWSSTFENHYQQILNKLK